MSEKPPIKEKTLLVSLTIDLTANQFYMIDLYINIMSLNIHINLLIDFYHDICKSGKEVFLNV